MLFKITNCNPADYVDDLNRCLALRNLITSYGLRKNVVILGTEAINQILDSNIYDKPTKNFVYEIDSTRREYYQIISQLLVYCIVDFNFDGIECNLSNNQFSIRMGYEYFVNTSNTEYINFITEGRNDFDMYALIAKYYVRKISPLNLEVGLNFCQGAGSQCKQRFDDLTNSSEITLCIIDNDKSHPAKGKGSTANLFKDFDKEYNNNSLTHIIDVREIESLIPIKVIEEVVCENKVPKDIEGLDTVKAFKTVNISFREYFDHKEGLSLKDAIDLDSKHGNYWLNILHTNHKFASSQCLINETCYKCYTCGKIEGFGDNILKRSLDYMNKLNLNSFDVEPDILTHWNKIGELILSWGCIPNSRPTRTS